MLKHINPNMTQFVREGIALAEADPSLLDGMLEIIEIETPAMVRHTGRFLPARRIAFAEGYVAASFSAAL